MFRVYVVMLLVFEVDQMQICDGLSSHEDKQCVTKAHRGSTILIQEKTIDGDVPEITIGSLSLE